MRNSASRQEDGVGREGDGGGPRLRYFPTTALFGDFHGMANREPPERYAGCLATGASPAPVATSLARRITGARLACDDCKIRSQCTNGRFRTVSRLENEAVLDRMQAQLAQRPSVLNRRRVPGGGRAPPPSRRILRVDGRPSDLKGSFHASPIPVSLWGPNRLGVRDGPQQLLKLNVLNVGMLITLHGLAMWIIWMSLEAKLHRSALSIAMETGSNGRFLRKCLPLRLQFSRRLREFRGVTNGQAGFHAQSCLFQLD